MTNYIIEFCEQQITILILETDYVEEIWNDIIPKA